MEGKYRSATAPLVIIDFGKPFLNESNLCKLIIWKTVFQFQLKRLATYESHVRKYTLLSLVFSVNFVGCALLRSVFFQLGSIFQKF